ncbi:hypothetical protein NQ318_019951 [Aromia moschata]|uniref:Gustatory receptor n=1 Tax=Aromia moschata TaxID=1265417 RepID=A0AAV8Y7C3_9CUCU|nr:hypothetical protein NQ318_019951 [Aromia moschata]
MYLMGQQLDVLFGWPMFFIFMGTVLQILNSISFVLINSDDGLRITDIINVLLYVLFTVYIAMSCDAIEKNCKKISATCYLLQEGMPLSPLRTELFLLGRYSGEVTSHFTAGGFFRVNQYLLMTLFSSVTTYLIVCIQFK